VGWKRIQRSGEIEKWLEGRTVVGVFRELRDGQFGPLLDLTDRDGRRVTFGVPTILKSFLDEVPPGTEIRITCKGKVPLKNGKEAWDFDVEQRTDKPGGADAHEGDADAPAGF
jgi:hypothetical protein